MMIYTVLKKDGQENEYLFYSWDEYHKATFNSEIEEVVTIELGRLHGKTYQERKSYIETKAIILSNNRYGGLSYGEEADIEAYFNRYGKRYGLLTDFHENAIC